MIYVNSGEQKSMMKVPTSSRSGGRASPAWQTAAFCVTVKREAFHVTVKRENGPSGVLRTLILSDQGSTLCAHLT